MNDPHISDQRRYLEIAAVVLTALGKFIFMDTLNQRLPFILAIIVLWTLYILRRKTTTTSILYYWGFRRDNFFKVVRMVVPFGLTAVAFSVGIGLFQGTLNITWHILPILVLYPIWGIIQQFLLMALVAGNLQDLKSHTIPKAVIILVTAVLFGLLHVPFEWLIVGTFLLALFYGYVYLKSRNLYVLGVFHGWLAAVLFYTVLNRDPFLEVFGSWLMQ